jgi:hypothetical protein
VSQGKVVSLLNVGVFPRHMVGGKLCGHGAFPVGQWAVGTPCNSVKAWFKLNVYLVNIARNRESELRVETKGFSSATRIGYSQVTSVYIVTPLRSENSLCSSILLKQPKWGIVQLSFIIPVLTSGHGQSFGRGCERTL